MKSIGGKLGMTVVALGLLAGAFIGGFQMAEAFERVRSDSVNKATLGNLRQITSAGRQYCIEHDVERVAYKDLMPEYFSYGSIVSLRGESYDDIVVERDGGVAYVRIPDTGYCVVMRY